MPWGVNSGWNGENSGWGRAAGGAVGTLSADGTANATWSTGTSFTVTLSTTKTNDVILLAVETNSALTSSISSANVTWGASARASSSPGVMSCWYGTASSILTNEVITINLSATPSFGSVIALAVNGCDISSPPTSIFDGNASIPATGGSGTPSGITTTKNATLIFGMIRGNGDGLPPAGWTDAGSSRATDFAAFDYKIFASPQTSLSIADTMTGVNGWVADALKASGQ